MTKKLKKKRGLYGPFLLVGTIIIFIIVVETCSRTLPEGEVTTVVHYCPPHPPENDLGQLLNSLECNELLIENPVRYHHPFSLSYNKTKPAGTSRIIFLGDSMTVGRGVSPERRFTALLGQWLDSLDQRCPGCTSYEILNFGVNGYNLEQVEQVFYESLDFEPDLVIYNYYTNDAEVLRLRVKDGRRVVESYNLNVLCVVSFPGNGWLLKHSRAYRFFTKKLSAIIQKVNPRFQPFLFHPNWPEVQEAFDGMIDTARQKQVPFVIMYAPRFDTSLPIGAARSEDFIPSRCHSGILIWDISQELAPLYTPGELRISNDDMHPNELGHAAIAEALQPYFERYVLDRSSLEHLVPAEDENAPCTVVSSYLNTPI